ncbi:MAG: lysylphosphatidylglycerol synthase transmembrane domain-containing protein [Eubacteriales bacterium]|nr:lysylphosphatidylglycerol synthase transmembrane domain-containing protein [Eubacteriales bacterium]
MKPAVRKVLNLLFIVATLAIIIAIAFSNNEMLNAWDTLFTLNPFWLCLAVVSLGCYVLFDALGYHFFLIKQKCPITLRHSLYVSLMGLYYGNITPGASGGQPMQVYAMSKMNVPVGVGTSAVSLRLFCNQLMVVLLASVLWICNADFVNAQLGGVRWAIIIGWVINFAAVPLVLLAALHRPLVQAVIHFFIKIGAKLRLVKDVDAARVRMDAVLDTYHSSILRLGRHPKQILIQLLLAGLSMLGLMGVTVFLYSAFGQSGVPWYRTLTVSFLLFLSASYTPLPGASGAQEGGFLVYYRGLFTEGTIGLALLVWRFITYYSFLLLGAFVTILHNLRSSRKKRVSPGAEN